MKTNKGMAHIVGISMSWRWITEKKIISQVHGSDSICHIWSISSRSPINCSNNLKQITKTLSFISSGVHNTGDYPHMPDVPIERNDPWYPYDFPELKRNFQEPVSKKTVYNLLPPTDNNHRMLYLTFRFTLATHSMMRHVLVHRLHFGTQFGLCGGPLRVL